MGSNSVKRLAIQIPTCATARGVDPSRRLTVHLCLFTCSPLLRVAPPAGWRWQGRRWLQARFLRRRTRRRQSERHLTRQRRPRKPTANMVSRLATLRAACVPLLRGALTCGRTRSGCTYYQTYTRRTTVTPPTQKTTHSCRPTSTVTVAQRHKVKASPTIRVAGVPYA